MAIKADNLDKNRLRSSNITVVISIAMVLFLIGIIGLIIINTNSYIDYLKEQMVIEVFFKNEKKSNPNSQSQVQYVDSLKGHPYVKSIKYITKEEATDIGKKELGVDSQVLFEENIFPASVIVGLKPEFIDSTHIETIKKQLIKNPIVDEIKSDNSLLEKMDKSVKKITIGISVLAIIILFIAVSLINNSIRLKIYSKRFIIKTMQLVGAKRSFIIRPFITESLTLGVLGAFIALLLLFATNYIITNVLHILPPIIVFKNHLILAAFILVLGILITSLSTWFATWRFLRLKSNDLYY
ncbi:FtsX-like permease family protein [Apibacter muscae]|uniref:Cell division protein FtsX n=1 Tax=Apibacter muscae TaxID=2509004 RepID=A0A563DH45_9FLAO|nr:permease-like cell division protein FtsX [Apibacter muscae]TWP29457.1 FtsX-like permease family protein [Apibacter muscae]